MTHPLTPREKVARALSPKCWEFYDRHVDDPRMDAEIKHEVAPSLQATDAILTALASGSGDHAPAAWRVKDFADGWIVCGSEQTAADLAAAMSGATVQPLYGPALLAEIAALRGERDSKDLEIGRLIFRATEAERTLAEAVGLVERSTELMTDEYVDTKAYREDARTFLGKEAER